MPGLTRLLRAAATSLSAAASAALARRAGGRQRGGRQPSPGRRVTGGRPRARAQRPPGGDEPSPGRYGPDATAEVSPADIGEVRMTYHPDPDGDPDPGEIVWTWVPFEEHDGRGKDRPVLVVAAEPSGTVLAVQLTSRDHDGDTDFVAIGSGAWDGEHRPSWVNIDRVMRVHPGGMRREASALDRQDYGRVAAALRHRYGWR